MAPKPPRPKGKKKKSYLGFKAGEDIPQRFSMKASAFGGFKTTSKDIPRYVTGDQWGPAGGSPDDISSIQRALIAGGYADNLRAGIWDNKSASAFEKLLKDSNRTGATWQDTLTAGVEGQKASEAGALGGSGSGSQKQGRVIEYPNMVSGGGTFRVPSTQETSVTMRGTFNELLGEDPAAEEELKFQEEIRNRNILPQAVAQGQEDAMKGAAFMQDTADVNAKVAGAGALDAGQDVTVGGQQANIPNKIAEEAPSAAALAEWIARTKYPEKFGATAINKRLGDMMSSLSSGSSGLQRPLAR